MLNFIKAHICTIKFFRYVLIIFLIVPPCTIHLGPNEFHNPNEESESVGLNYLISNDLSEFSGSNFIEKEANGFLQQWNLAGMTMSIVKDGKLVYAQGFGYSDIEARQQVSPGNLFRVASVSKLITAVAIMKLVEKKLITLDSKVFGPDAILKDPVFNSVVDKRLYNITIRQLLAHSGGWSLHYGDPAFNSLVVLERTGEKGAATMDSYCRFVATRKLHFEPGTRSSYSNMGYMFLGKVINAVTGRKYEDFVRKEVLIPAGISDMHMGRSYLSGRRINEVKYYESEESPMIPAFDGSSTLVPKPYGGNPIELLGPAGGWIASSVELAKLLVLIDDFKNVPDMIPQSLINQMVEEDDLRGPLGWKAVKKNGDWIRTGSMAGTSAIMKRQSNGFSWVVVINSSSWKGPRLPAYINYMMGKIEKNLSNWPKHDLFKYVPEKL
ncbi:MAG: serine hydrolase domain-containing protein [Bacteroidota bacterium]|nr:serine hydrolase [Odoribacter sp.]MDP3643528.1 serine hydrolase domain-containing protein [Bacteroidota bacterium]